MVASSITLTPTPAPTSALSIAGRAGHAFTPQAMLQGFVCHARGVELTASGPARVHARVRSKRMHDVHLRAEQGRLLVACSCPARSFGLDVCKHAWAALLEVDRQDALADLRKSRGPLVVEPAPPPPSPPVLVTEDARDAQDEKTEKRSLEGAAKASGTKMKALAKTTPPPKKTRRDRPREAASTPKEDKRETKKAAAKRPARSSRDRASKRR